MARKHEKEIEIRTVEEQGFFDFRWVQADRIQAIRADFERNYEIELPQPETWGQYGRIKDLRLLLNPYTTTITHADSSWEQYKFYPGYLTDLASVPAFFRSIIDQDDPELVAGALPHDFNFSTHYQSFRHANGVLRDVAELKGFSALKAGLVWLAVSSPVGLYKYRKAGPMRDTWTRRTAEALDSSGRHLPRIAS